MEKAKILFLGAILAFVFGCATPSVSNRDIVLIDSEIPWKMSTGEYVSHGGDAYVVTEDKPRWSVSEAWVFENYSKEKEFNSLSTIKIITAIFIIIFALMLFRYLVNR